MKLSELLADLDSLPDETFICACRPWTHDCEIELVPYPDDLRIPDSVKARGFEYFLEVDTIQEILEGFLPYAPSQDQIVDYVLYYAEHDAFPDWAKELCSH